MNHSTPPREEVIAVDEDTCALIADLADRLLAGKDIHRRYVAFALTEQNPTGTAFAERIGMDYDVMIRRAREAHVRLSQLRWAIAMVRTRAMLAIGASYPQIADRFGRTYSQYVENMIWDQRHLTREQWMRTVTTGDELTALAALMERAGETRVRPKPLPQWRKAG